MNNKNIYGAVGFIFSLMLGVVLGIIFNNRIFGIGLGVIAGALITIIFFKKEYQINYCILIIKIISQKNL